MVCASCPAVAHNQVRSESLCLAGAVPPQRSSAQGVVAQLEACVWTEAAGCCLLAVCLPHVSSSLTEGPSLSSHNWEEMGKSKDTQ